MIGQFASSYHFGRFCLSPSRRTLYLDESEIALTPKCFEVLLYLAQNPGRVVTKEEILKAVWADAFIEESNLAQQIFRLRRALEVDPGAARFIQTMPGRGYQFTAEISHGSSVGFARMTANAVPASSLDDPAANFVLDRWRERTSFVVEEFVASPIPRPSAVPQNFWWVALAISLLGILAVGGWGLRLWKGHKNPDRHQVVIADFLNTTGDPTFDQTLNRALEIDLAQSPYMDVLGQRGIVDTLQLMGRPTDTPIVADIAREICERTNRQVVLTGSISQIGNQYLLTLQGADCAKGRRVAAAKAEAKTKEAVPEALDAVAEQIRGELNESRTSVENYEVPLREATTSSLDALKAYSVGTYLQSQGASHKVIVAAFQRAIDFDPRFAMAYRELGRENSYLGQRALSAVYMQKAFEFSDHLTTFEKLIIRCNFYSQGQRNQIEAIKVCSLLAETFPQDQKGITNVVDCYMTLGQWDAALANGERGQALFPDSPIMDENLATIYRSLNRLEDAKRATLQAARIGKGETGTHLSLYEIALAQHDQQALDRETQWFDAQEDGTSVWYYPSFRGATAASLGKQKLAEHLFQNAYESALRAGLPEAADSVLADQAEAEFALGFQRQGVAALSKIHALDPESPLLAILQTKTGDTTTAEQFLILHAREAHDTLMVNVFLPEVRAALAMEHGKPLDAVAALESAIPYEMRDYTVPTLRAQAYLQAAKPELAAAEYQKILSHPGIEPTCILWPMAQLGLARADALQGKTADSRKEYERLFALWAGADADLPSLRQARLEYSRLPA